MMISVTGLLLLSFYAVTFFIGLYVSINRYGYFIERLRKGDISLFVFGAVIFVNSYTLSMVGAFSSRLRLELALTDHIGANITTYIWTLGQIGCMFGLAIICYNVFTNHYDIAIVTARRRRELEDVNTTGPAVQIFGADGMAESSGEAGSGKTD